MSTHERVTVPPARQLYGALSVVGLVCGLLIVAVHEVTRPIIARNKVDARQSAILRVLPRATTSAAFRLDDSGRFAPAPADAEGEGLVFAGYDAQRRLVGFAVEASGMGYQDVIRLLYGYAFERQAIIGIEVLESRETPGLGTRIETDPAFLRNFEQLDVSLDASGGALAQPVTAVRSGQKEAPWEVDCISGATISSQAVASMLRDSAARWIPRLVRRLEDFRHPE